MRHAISERSGHIAFLEDMREWVARIKSKGTRQLPCLIGWKLSIQALMMIWDVLHTQYKLSYLLTNRLNQDCVENLFSVIRAKGGQRDNPDCSQFRAAFRQVMVDAVLMPGRGANCTEDVDKFIFSLASVHTPGALQPPVPPPHPVMDDVPESVRAILSVCTLPPQAHDGLSDQETNILAYIGGYIVRKLQVKICHDCEEKITGEIEEDDVHHKFLAKKNLVDAKYGLMAPSGLLLGIIQQLELEYRKQIDVYMYSEHVKADLVAILLKEVHMNTLKCNTCHLELLIVHIMINIRLNHTLKISNRSLRDSKSRKNRKELKFSHK
jgi:hypothetical protein